MQHTEAFRIARAKRHTLPFLHQIFRQFLQMWPEDIFEDQLPNFETALPAPNCDRVDIPTLPLHLTMAEQQRELKLTLERCRKLVSVMLGFS